MRSMTIARPAAGDAEVTRLGSNPMPRWLTKESAAAVAGLEPLTFPVSEFAARLGRVRAELTRRGLDAVLVFRASSVEYLCGHHTVNPFAQPLLVTHDEARLYVPEIELARALTSSMAPSINCFVTESVGGPGEGPFSLIVDDVMGALGKASKLAFEADDPRVPGQLLRALSKAQVVVEDGRQLIERIRLILSPLEIKKLERAAEATQRGVAACVAAASVKGAKDSSVAAAIAAALLDGTNSHAATWPIVCTGLRGGVHHANWADVPLADGPTFCQFSGTFDRYHAPVMLTVMNREPNRLERRLEGLAQAVLAGVLEEARPGRVAGDVAAALAKRLGTLEDSDTFHGNFGYSVGLAHPPIWADSAEWSIVRNNEEALQAGMAFHVPASFRSFGRCTVGLSHTIVIEDSGARVLTGHDRHIHRV